MKPVVNKINCITKLQSFSIKLILILFYLFLNNRLAYTQSHEVQRVHFIWTDNAFKTEINPFIYITGNAKHSTDTIFPSQWVPSKSDTITFVIKKYSNPVHVELSYGNVKKKSNDFILIPSLTYTLTELDDKIKIEQKLIVFDTMNEYAKLLYSFLIKLIIELLLAIPVAALFRLPARLYFFVFVSNIMSFPVIYIPFLPLELKELLTIVLEGIFISLIGWKRLRWEKAMLISLILNVVRFGIAKIIMLIIKII